MAKVNQFCETKNCGSLASHFGLKEGRKIPACREHLSSLADKRLQMFDIEGYSFISSYQDAGLFVERKAVVEKARGTLAALLSSCDAELSEASAAIENAKSKVLKSIEQRFGEMQVAATKVCEQAKQQLSEIEANLDLFLSSKENSLSPAALLISSMQSVVPKFVRFGIADVADFVSSALSDSWAVADADVCTTLRCLDRTQKNEAVESALAEALQLAQKGIHNALLYADSLIGDDASFDEGKYKVILEILRVEKSQVERNLKWLQRSWQLGQQSNEATAEVGLKLASFLYRQSGKFLEAEELLRCCFAQVQNSLPELSMALCNELCGVYLASAKYTQLDEMAVWTLGTFEHADLPAEYYWTTLLYLTYSKQLQSRESEASATLEYWRKKLRKGSRLAEMIQSLTEGIDACAHGRQKEAEELLLSAWRVGSSHFPTAPFTALCSARLAATIKHSAREEHYHKHAQSIYEVASPRSIQAAISIMNLGLFLQASKRLKEAESSFHQAKSIFEVAGPNSMDAAVNLTALGSCYRELEKWREAKLHYIHAQSIYELAGPQSVKAAKNLMSLGTLHYDQKRLDEAEEYIQKAWSICAAVSPDSSLAGDTLVKWGNLLHRMERLEDAMQCYLYALSIYESITPRYLGTLHEVLNQASQAIEYFQKAAAIFAEVGDVGLKAEVEGNISRLMRLSR